jgi:hypothetical protein
VQCSDPVVDKAEVETPTEAISIDNHQPEESEANESTPIEPELPTSDGVDTVHEEVAPAASVDMSSLVAPTNVSVSSRCKIVSQHHSFILKDISINNSIG